MVRLTRSSTNMRIMRPIVSLVLVITLVATTSVSVAAQKRTLTEYYANGIAFVNDVIGVFKIVRELLRGNFGKLLGIRPEVQPLSKSGLELHEIISIAEGLIQEGYYPEGTSVAEIAYNTFQLKDGTWITRDQLRQMGKEYVNGQLIPYLDPAPSTNKTYIFRLKDYPKILIRGEMNQFYYTYEILTTNTKGETEVVWTKAGSVALDWNNLRPYYGCNTSIVLELPYETPAGKGTYKDPIPLQFIGESRSALTVGGSGTACQSVTTPVQGTQPTTTTPTSTLPKGFQVVTGDQYDSALKNWQSTLQNNFLNGYLTLQQIEARITYLKDQEKDLLIKYDSLLRDAFVRQPDLANQCVGVLLEGSYHFSAVVEEFFRRYLASHNLTSCSPYELVAYLETDQMRRIRETIEQIEAEIELLEQQLPLGFGL